MERSGRISCQVLTEYFSVVTRKLRPGLPAPVAWDDVQRLFAWNPLPTDSELLARAYELTRLHGLNWWDAQIVGAAQALNCSLLLTEDLQDGAVYGGVTVRNPFGLGVREAKSEYAALRQAIDTPPPRRGRPRKVRAAA